jgi:starch synthase (maltosyl-transferring)
MRGFRCDAAYKVPGEIWRTIIAAAREVRSDIVIAAETLGAPLEAVTRLRPAGFDYLFNSSKWWDFRAGWLLDQYEQFRHIAPSIAFPESHDTPRLAAELAGRPAAEIEAEYRFRYLFAAFFSSGVMMPVGYEFGFDRPLDVVRTRPDYRQTPRFDITSFVAEVNAMKASVPALNEEGSERVLGARDNAVGLLRNAAAGTSSAVALINPGRAGDASIDAADVLRGGRRSRRHHLERRIARDADPGHAGRCAPAGNARFRARPVVIEALARTRSP